MKKSILILRSFFLYSFFLSSSFCFAEPHSFVGVKKCSMCHKSEKKGNQYKHWLNSKHAKAFHTLKSDEAIKVAKEKGLTLPPHEAPECLRCHVTAHGVEASLLGKKFKKEEGVQCESCHGAGKDYSSSRIMKNRELSITKGLILPTKEICLKCHNEEAPTYQGFDFDEAFKKIAHPRP